MINKKWATAGSRLRYVRKEVLGLTQERLATELGCAKSLIPTMEADKQGVSRQTVEKLYAQYGVNPTWLISGDGSPLSKSESKMNGSEQKVIKNDKSPKAKAGKSGGELFLRPGFFKDESGPGRFGYLNLGGTKLRLHAARDNLLAGSALYKLVEDDQLWFAAGEPGGWEFEVLREYFAAGSDRTVVEWMECLRFIRWARRALIEAIEVSLVEEARSA